MKRLSTLIEARDELLIEEHLEAPKKANETSVSEAAQEPLIESNAEVDRMLKLQLINTEISDIAK